MSQGDPAAQAAREAQRERDSAHVHEEAERLRRMHDAELIDFVRDTVAQLEALADRLEGFVSDNEEGTDNA